MCEFHFNSYYLLKKTHKPPRTVSRPHRDQEIGQRNQEDGRRGAGQCLLFFLCDWTGGGELPAESQWCWVCQVLHSWPPVLSPLPSIHCRCCIWLPMCYLPWPANKNCIPGWKVEVLTSWDPHIVHLVQVPLPQIPCQVQALALGALWNLVNPCEPPWSPEAPALRAARAALHILPSDRTGLLTNR